MARNEKEPGESVWRYAARGAAYFVGFLTPIVVLCVAGDILKDVLGGTALHEALSDHFEGAPWVVYILASMGVAFFVAFALFELTGMRSRCTPASSTPVIAKACLLCTLWSFVLALFFAMVLPVADGVESVRGGPAPTETLMKAAQTVPLYIWILAPGFFMLLMVASAAFERRQYVEWTHIDVEE